eukprot:5713702-Heterocapsa_arctica.AAC.1
MRRAAPAGPSAVRDDAALGVASDGAAPGRAALVRALALAALGRVVGWFTTLLIRQHRRWRLDRANLSNRRPSCACMSFISCSRSMFEHGLTSSTRWWHWGAGPAESAQTCGERVAPARWWRW